MHECLTITSYIIRSNIIYFNANNFLYDNFEDLNQGCVFDINTLKLIPTEEIPSE